MVKRKIKTRKFIMRIGNIPDHAVLLQTFGGWSLYVRNISEQWVNMKLISIGTIPGKANYWLAYSVEKKTFTPGREALGLKQWHLHIYDDLLNWLNTHEAELLVCAATAGALQPVVQGKSIA